MLQSNKKEVPVNKLALLIVRGVWIFGSAGVVKATSHDVAWMVGDSSVYPE
jgi:hypothetical protein